MIAYVVYGWDKCEDIYNLGVYSSEGKAKNAIIDFKYNPYQYYKGTKSRLKFIRFNIDEFILDEEIKND